MACLHIPCGCCIYFRDRFDRTDIGDNWTVNSGSWSIVNGELTTTSSNAQILCNIENPEANDEHVYRVWGKSTADGDQILFITSDLDTVDHWVVELTYGASSSTFKLFEIAGGTPTQRGVTKTETDVTTGTRVFMRICFGTNDIVLQYKLLENDPSYRPLFKFATTDITDSIIGVGTGTLTGTATFGDVTIAHHHDTKPRCPRCDALATCPACTGRQELLLEFSANTLVNGRCNACADPFETGWVAQLVGRRGVIFDFTQGPINVGTRPGGCSYAAGQTDICRWPEFWGDRIVDFIAVATIGLFGDPETETWTHWSWHVQIGDRVLAPYVVQYETARYSVTEYPDCFAPPDVDGTGRVIIPRTFVGFLDGNACSGDFPATAYVSDPYA